MMNLLLCQDEHRAEVNKLKRKLEDEEFNKNSLERKLKSLGTDSFARSFFMFILLGLKNGRYRSFGNLKPVLWNRNRRIRNFLTS
jgi:hypothetical protein